MSIIGTATNSSPYLAAPAAAAIENGKNHFVTLGENGVSLATEGVAAVGILRLTPRKKWRQARA